MCSLRGATHVGPAVRIVAESDEYRTRGVRLTGGSNQNLCIDERIVGAIT